jgi:hypothetical protein
MVQSGVLGNRLVGILHSCLRHHRPYNEHTAWATPHASGGSTTYEPGIYRQTGHASLMRNTPGLPGGALCPAGPRLRSRLAQTLDNGGVGHPAALAHRLQPVTTAALFERIHECCHDARTASAQRVADRDGPSVDVRPL